jgi:pyruvate formate lyase activating enzyme
MSELQRDAVIETGDVRGILFDVQRFSIHDGPGIRTTLFFKGCPLRCLWCQNPESHKPGREIAFYRERCARCFNCREICPERAILEGEDRRVDYTKCTVCGECAAACDRDALRVVGTCWEPHPLLDEILRDRDFFMDSGGGITLSGGEPAAQSAFLEVFLPLVKAEGIHVNMETCGMFRWEDMKPLLPHLDLIYYDLKLMDPEAHRNYTGSSNRVILENFKKIARDFPNLEVRMPVVPSINDTPENILDTAGFLKENRQASIYLLRYHHMGEAKLPKIDTNLTPLKLQGDASRALLSAKKLFENEGICAILNE